MTSIIRCMQAPHVNRCFFFFNDTATTEIYTLSLHDALPISELDVDLLLQGLKQACAAAGERSGVEFLIDDSRVSEKRLADAEARIYEARVYFKSFYGEGDARIRGDVDGKKYEPVLLPVPMRHF